MISTQYKTRKKYEKIKCPQCGSISKAEWTMIWGIQKRICHRGHVFYYAYILEAIQNWALNYRIKI
jgi:hypothetical protein